MAYIENPKTAGSGMLCCIPQKGRCPQKCADCFFQSGRSYLEPLDKNLPNMPSVEQAEGKVVWVNDGNDSSIQFDQVVEMTAKYKDKFYNTSYIARVGEFPGPVVLTVNPGALTDSHVLELCQIPNNLMFVRVRTNMWNLENVVDKAVKYYTSKDVPVVLTFMAYHNQVSSIPFAYRQFYNYRQRTRNPYWAITTLAWKMVMERYFPNRLVYSCGKIEGEFGSPKCFECGVCISQYFATKTAMELCKQETEE